MRLFDRGRSGVTPTAAGKMFIRRAEQLLLFVRGIEHDMSLLRGGLAGSVSFGIGPLPAACFLKDLLHHLVTRHPDLEVHLEVCKGNELLDRLMSERLEFVVAAENYLLDSPLLIIRPLVKLRLNIFGRRDHPLTANKPLKNSDIDHYPLLAAGMRAESSSARNAVLGVKKTSQQSGVVCSDDFSSLKEVALNSNALLLAPYAAVANECIEGTLVQLLALDRPKFKVNFVIASLADRMLSPLAELIIKRTLELAAQVDGNSATV